MIYGHINIAEPEAKVEKPQIEGFYERNYNGCWHRDYWDGRQWYFVKGGKPAVTQVREWRVITREEVK
jgi:hypothetical protein